jgi:hypothetical protein
MAGDDVPDRNDGGDHLNNATSKIPAPTIHSLFPDVEKNVAIEMAVSLFPPSIRCRKTGAPPLSMPIFFSS